MVRLPFVQKWLGRQVEDVIEKKLGTDVNVGQVYLGFLNRVIIDNFELYDKQNKKMLKASRLAARIDYGELISNRRIYISSAQVFGMDATLYKKDEHAKANYQFILDSLATKDKNKKSNLELSINSLIIRHGAIRYDRYDMAPTPSRFNVNHLDIKDISGHIIMPYYTHDSLAISVKKLSMKESSGIDLRRLKFDFTFAKNNTADKRNLKVANIPSVICKLNDFEINLPNTDIRISNIEAKSYDKSKKLNINSATEKEITNLPGINVIMAKRIIKYRDLHGGFNSLGELYSEMKIKPHFQLKLNDLICVREVKTKQIESKPDERIIDF